METWSGLGLESRERAFAFVSVLFTVGHCARAHIHAHTYVHACAHTYMHMHPHTCTHIHARAHTHACMHTLAALDQLSLPFCTHSKFPNRSAYHAPTHFDPSPTLGP